jgi:hypothetical protein
MKFKSLHGREKKVSNIKKYLIDWDSPSRSKFQFAVKNFLKKYWINHVVFEEFPLVGSKMSFDFYNSNRKVAVEVQGGQHTKYTPFFHGFNKINYISQLSRDKQKLDFCNINDITLVEIYPNDQITPNLFAKFGVKLI